MAELGHARQRRGSLATAPALARLRLRAILLGPGWGPATWLALVVAGLGGVAPVGFLGEPGQGLAAGALNGVVAAGILAPVWTPPLVATIVCTEAELGIDGHRWVAGIRPTDPRRRRRVEAAFGTVAILMLATLLSVLGAVLANAVAPGEWSLGLAGWTGAGGTVFAVSSVVVSTLLSVTVGELCGRRRMAVVLLEGSVLATAALLAVLYFVPLLRPLQVVSPWIGMWPLRAQQQHSPLLASSIDERLAAVVTAVWVIALVIASLRCEPGRVPGV